MEDRSETVDELDARVVVDAVLDAQEHEELLHEGLVDVHYGVFLAFERVPKELLHPGACNPVTEKALFAVTFTQSARKMSKSSMMPLLRSSSEKRRFFSLEAVMTSPR